MLCTSSGTIQHDPGLVRSVVEATKRGYELTNGSPGQALDDLMAGASGLDRSDQDAQLHALLAAGALRPTGFHNLSAWARWDVEHGVLARPPDIRRAFDTRFAG